MERALVEELRVIGYRESIMKSLRLPIAFCLAVLLLGCATTRIDWNSRIGQYTYDDAVIELGVPDRQAELSDGSIVGEWLVRRGGAYGQAHFFPGSRFHTYDINEMPDGYLRLVFGPDKLLRSANRFAR